jgi:Na+-driven multidrug efflux pump
MTKLQAGPTGSATMRPIPLPLPLPANEALFFHLSCPLLVESTIYLLVGVVDAAILARVSTQATAAVGPCTFVITFLVTIVMGFGQGSCISISHRIGAGKSAEAAAIALVSSLINIVFGLLLGLIVYLARQQIPTWLGLTGEAHADAVIFLSIVGDTTSLWSLLISTSYILKSYGYTKYNMYKALLVNVINASLAWIAVEDYFGLPKMGALKQPRSWSDAITGHVNLLMQSRNIEKIFASHFFHRSRW